MVRKRSIKLSRHIANDFNIFGSFVPDEVAKCVATKFTNFIGDCGIILLMIWIELLVKVIRSQVFCISALDYIDKNF